MAETFQLKDGTEVHTVPELAIALLSMSDEVFSHHVTKNRNDFALWIKDVFQEAELARMVAQADSKKDMIKRLIEYQSTSVPFAQTLAGIEEKLKDLSAFKNEMRDWVLKEQKYLREEFNSLRREWLNHARRKPEDDPFASLLRYISDHKGPEAANRVMKVRERRDQMEQIKYYEIHEIKKSVEELKKAITAITRKKTIKKKK